MIDASEDSVLAYVNSVSLQPEPKKMPEESKIAATATHDSAPKEVQISTAAKSPQSRESPPVAVDDIYFDDEEELKRIETEKAKGKSELVGCVFINKPDKIIGACKDNFNELLYLVAFESTAQEVYTPTWC